MIYISSTFFLTIVNLSWHIGHLGQILENIGKYRATDRPGIHAKLRMYNLSFLNFHSGSVKCISIPETGNFKRQ